MIAKKHTLTVTLAVCTLALATLGIAEQSIERPFIIDGHMTITVNLTTGRGVSMDWGEATHLGRYDSQGSIELNLETGEVITWSGVVTAADGDKIFWVVQPGDKIEFTGGTGHFENVTGGAQAIPLSEDIITFPDANTMVETFTYKGVGRITY